MSALMVALVQCASTLEIVRVNDNWLKAGATGHLIELLVKGRENLEVLDISDCNIGAVNVLVALRALKKSQTKTLKSFSCNYNEVENKEAAKECLDILLELKAQEEEEAALSSVDFIGNFESRKLTQEYAEKFNEAGVTLKLKEVDEDEDDDLSEGDDDEEEEEDEDEELDQDKLAELTEKLDQLTI